MKIQELFEAQSPEFKTHKKALSKVMKDWNSATGGHDWIPETKKYAANFSDAYDDEEAVESWAREKFDGVTHWLGAPQEKDGALVYGVDFGSSSRAKCAAFLRQLLKSRGLSYKVVTSHDDVTLIPNE